MTIITKDALDFIQQNSSLTSAELRDCIKEKFNVDISESAVWVHMKKARKQAKEATRCSDSIISKKISERVESNLSNMMEMMEGEILELHKALQGKSHKIMVRPDFDKDGNPTDFMQVKEYIVVEKAFQDSLKNYVALRPSIQTVKIEGLGSRAEEDEFMKSLSDEEIALLEGIARKREKVITVIEPDTEGS